MHRDKSQLVQLESISWEEGALVQWEQAVGDDHVKWETSLEVKGVGGGKAACDYSAVSSVDNFLILECHRKGGTSQERHMWEPRVDETYVSVQKRSNSLEGPRKVKAIELEYPRSKVQFGAEVLRWEQKDKVGSTENYEEFLIKGECWISYGSAK